MALVLVNSDSNAVFFQPRSPSALLRAGRDHDGVRAAIVGPQYGVGTIDGRPTATTWLRAPTLAPEHEATSAMLESLGAPAIEAGGVTLYQLSPQALAPYRKLTALAMEARRPRAIRSAAARGRALSRRGPQPRVVEPPSMRSNSACCQTDGSAERFLEATIPIRFFVPKSCSAPPSGIAVEIEGQPDALEPIIRSYGADATRIYFPYPAPLLAGSAPQAPAMRKSSMMVMTFDRAGLARAAACARAALEG
jgi:hypothetical protein